MIIEEEKYKKGFETIERKLKSNTFLSTTRNNKLMHEFLKAKMNGGFGRLMYQKRIGFKTAAKKCRNIVRMDLYFKKDFDKITEEDLLKYRDLLNDDEVYCDKTLVKWKKVKEKGKIVKKPYTKIVKTKKSLSYRTKLDYKQNFIDLYSFIIEYVFQTEKRELKDITKYFMIRKPSDFNEIVVDFIPDDELRILFKNIKNWDFKALIQLSIMSGARPSEIINVKYGRKYNLYKNSEGKWIIHLPKIKRISYKKFPFVIDMYEEDLYPYFSKLEVKEGDMVFNITSATFRKLMKYYTEKYVKKAYSPKILRKTARMIRTNAGYSEMWINKLMGHAPGSKVQGHYTNYEGIKNEHDANDKLKAQQFPNLKRDYDNMKMELQALEQKQKSIMEKMEKERGPSDEFLNWVMKDAEMMRLVKRKIAEKNLAELKN
jgi:integrase